MWAVIKETPDIIWIDSDKITVIWASMKKHLLADSFSRPMVQPMVAVVVGRMSQTSAWSLCFLSNSVWVHLIIFRSPQSHCVGTQCDWGDLKMIRSPQSHCVGTQCDWGDLKMIKLNVYVGSKRLAKAQAGPKHTNCAFNKKIWQIN